MTPIEITPACVLLAAGWLIVLVGWAIKSGDKWRRARRRGRWAWATR